MPGNCGNYVTKYEELCDVQKPTSTIYHSLTANDHLLCDCYQRWLNNYTLNLSFKIYQKSFLALKKVTNDMKFHDFQYRLLLNRVPANKQLYRWGIKSSDLCNYCGEKEDIIHLLFDCTRIFELWTQFAMFISTVFEAELFVLNTEELLLNRIHVDDKHLANLYCLIFKQCIYRCKCQKINFTFAMFINEIKVVQAAEYSVAKSQKRQ